MTDGRWPEHEKLKAISAESQTIGEFLEFGGYTLCTYVSSYGEYLPVSKSRDQVLAEYFHIDLEALEREKRAMLAALRGEAT